MAFARDAMNGRTLTAESFLHPPPEMGILPFWFWNGEMNEKEMEWQLREYKSRGIPGVFIHGRFGLKVPYLSEAWFRKVRFAVARGKDLGLDVWVYDEMNWPSGTAERSVPREFPHLRQKYLELVALQVDGPLFTFLEATDNRYVNTGDSWPVAAFGCTEEEFQTGITHPIDLTQNLSFERVIPWEAPPGKWRLLYFLQKDVPYYIDTLNPESTQRFIEFTHEKYRKAVGGEFGGTVPGFYTDEPAMHYYHVGIDNWVIPWTTQMFRIFREKRGYDLRPWLPALYLPMGEKTARVRYDFWRTLTEQYAETYYGQIRTWCEKNGVLFTGHLLFEEWLRMHARCEGNLFKYLQKFHVIGVDHLYPKVGTAREPAEHVALKIASSAAHQFGSARLLCESMGGAYWDCTLERMKWIANWEYVLGVNLFNNHGYHYSIEGERKRDWPPSQFYHHTWWHRYDSFTGYMARASHLLSGGRHVARILVLYPINSIWANYLPQTPTEGTSLTERDFAYLTDTLLRLHYDFDYVDEDVLAGAGVDGGKITLRDETYEALILPPVTHIKRGTFNLLQKFAAGGGTLIGDTLLPHEFLEDRTGEPAAVAAKDRAAGPVRSLFGMDPLKPGAASGGGGSVGLHRKKGKGNVFVFTGPGLHNGSGKKKLADLLGRCVKADVTISEEDVFYLHRIKDDHEVYFLANTSLEEKKNVAVSFLGEGVPEAWDLSTGEMSPVPVYRAVKGRTAVTLDFPPAGARVIVFRRGPLPLHVAATNLDVMTFDGKTLVGSAGALAKRPYALLSPGNRRLEAKAKRPLRPLPFPQKWNFRLGGDNALLLSSFRMLVGDPPGGRRQAAQVDLDDRGWLAVKPGAWEMQLPAERTAAEYPVTLWYRLEAEAAFVPPDLRLLVDGFSGKAHDLYINGEPVRGKGRRSSLDAEIMEIDVARYFRTGRNVIAIRLIAAKRTDGLLDPVRLVGGFALEETGGILQIVPTPAVMTAGDLASKGFPFFSGTAVYAAEVEVPEAYARGRLTLEVACGDDLLEVAVNGGGEKVLPWHPYRLSLTGELRPGTNRIELRVTNTLINLLEGVRRPSGLLGEPCIRHEHIYTLAHGK
ncbi:MAG TPA: glycosyl hydrolase [Bacteroidota bacterium]|nr:glycosyl hydrolase [Bacteroidota bacterium]